ncbi:hypothetical protein EHQ53_03775 [Leptospira langatensis]|uniref:DUF975 family protein n=1 Tax=Leptospira langatensis TaxID=2484983 RepID=A0A5F1ZYJ8_9LEPT|nr:hypothetical protein [Leptospira langatensis]TGK04278.1 hypothetical protein EHO57_04005 [Leptospira langatensis]TGL43758.1 hypothetical protein EHQ53_03775 [Leptospira langatensis]
MDGRLTIEGIIKNSIALGLKNFLTLFVAFILWILTLWIPYFNVGTTIGLFYYLPIKIGKGESVSPTDIFDAGNRKYMGEFFLTYGLISVGVSAGLIFLIIPAMVIGISWGQALFLLLDKGLEPSQAIKKSNDITYGKKWTIFLGSLLLVISIAIGGIVLGWIAGMISMYLRYLIALVLFVIFFPIVISSHGYIYDSLTKEAGI